MKLISAIEMGGGELAAKIMREHTERTRQTYLSFRDK
jgi:DNA-binding GntR family transcriptional regulator